MTWILLHGLREMLNQRLTGVQRSTAATSIAGTEAMPTPAPADVGLLWRPVLVVACHVGPLTQGPRSTRRMHPCN